MIAIQNGCVYINFSGNKNIAGQEEEWKKFVNDKRRLVIFGAGNLAELYLDSFAWKNDVLFLVDNDRNKQNVSLKGYLIRHPNELLNYQQKVKVLVTNEKYEDDIVRQLENMGIDKPYRFASMQMAIARKYLKGNRT